jgi:hypothetical protein
LLMARSMYWVTAATPFILIALDTFDQLLIRRWQF